MPQFTQQVVVTRLGKACRASAALEGEVFTDGSMIQPSPQRARRAGWSVVTTDSLGRFLTAFYGCTGDGWPSPYRAELQGVLQALTIT